MGRWRDLSGRPAFKANRRHRHGWVAMSAIRPSNGALTPPPSDPAMTASTPPRHLTCPRCGAGFECRTDGGCWCNDEPFRMPLDEAAIAEGCLCPTCLRKAAAEAEGPPSHPQ
jgi:hypothetical protein